jgi:hypothetical protein
MTCDLDRFFGEMRLKLPKDARSRLLFSSSSFDGCPERVETDQMVLTKSTHEYGSGYRADLVRFRAKRETFQELAFLILAVVFRPGGGRVQVALSHPQSTIKNLVVAYSGLTPRSAGHKTKPDQFPYSPSKVEKHPWNWCGYHWELYSFPSFTLTNMKEFVVSEADWASRDTVLGFGNDDANIRLADLLLSLGYSDQREIVLEGEGGNRGVGINSAEAVFEVSEPETL